MRIFVPEQAVSKGYSSTVTLLDGTKAFPVIGIAGGLSDVPNTFWDTKGRQENNCLHVKLVDNVNPGAAYRKYSVSNGHTPGGDFLAFNGEWFTGTTGNQPSYHSIHNYVVREEKGKDWTPKIIAVDLEMTVRLTGNAVLGYGFNFKNGTTAVIQVSLNTQSARNPIPKTYNVKGLFGSERITMSNSYGDKTVYTYTGSGDASDLFIKYAIIGSLPPSADSHYATREDAVWAMVSWLEPYTTWVTSVIVSHFLKTTEYRTWTATKAWSMDNFVLPKLSEDRFLLEEPMLVRESIPLVSNPLAGYWRNWLIQHAYYDACESVPVMSDNNISNIIEIVGFIKSLVLEHRVEIPKSLRDIWLSYRYSYSTTRSDVEEAIDFVHRYMDLGGLDRSLTCHGSASCDYGGTTVTCRCRFDISPRELGYLEEIWRTLYTYGLSPNFYVVWDMVPYSFMVDWFIPIGDMASVADAEHLYCGDTYDISNVVFSLQYSLSDSGYRIACYARWASKPLQSFNELYWLDKPATRNKTIICRVLDTVSIFVR